MFSLQQSSSGSLLTFKNWNLSLLRSNSSSWFL